MVLDYNLFEPGKPLKNGTFIISEQIPGYVSTAATVCGLSPRCRLTQRCCHQVINNDLSQLVQENGYFGSYNTAFDPYLRQISGADAAEVKGGPWLGYWTTARAQLFRRDQSGKAARTLRTIWSAFFYLQVRQRL